MKQISQDFLEYLILFSRIATYTVYFQKGLAINDTYKDILKLFIFFYKNMLIINKSKAIRHQY